MAKQLGFHFDASACIGCKACQVACQDKNNLPAGMRWRRVFEYSGGSWIPQGNVMVPSQTFAYYLSVSCMHCADPICLKVCPVGAISKRSQDGVVLLDSNKCIGCRYCEWACPYGAVRFNADAGKMTKCTFCADLLDQGQNPVCVDSCPMRALDFGDVDQLKAKYNNVTAIAPLPVSTITSPSFVITPHPQSQPVGAGTGTIGDLEEM